MALDAGSLLHEKNLITRFLIPLFINVFNRAKKFLEKNSAFDSASSRVDNNNLVMTEADPTRRRRVALVEDFIESSIMI